MSYSKKVLMAVALIIIALPNSFIAMEKETKKAKIAANPVIYHAIENNDIAKVKEILNKSPDEANASYFDGYATSSVLSTAVWRATHGIGNYDIVNLLLDRGAEIDKRTLNYIEQAIYDAKTDLQQQRYAYKSVELKKKLAYAEQLKSYIDTIKERRKLQQEWQQIEAKRISEWQTAHPKEILQLKTLKREQ